MNSLISAVFLLPVVIFGANAVPDDGGEAKESSPLSADEQEAYNKFHDAIMPKIPDDSKIKKFIETQNVSYYLLTWLREEELDVEKAEARLLEHLEWRKKENVDEIDKESFEKFEKELPAFFDTVGMKGEPVLEVWYSSWKVEQYVDAGKQQEVLRYITYFLEMNNRRIYEQLLNDTDGDKNDDGMNGALMIVDLKNMAADFKEHAECLELLQKMFTLVKDNYPSAYRTIFLLNAQMTSENFTSSFSKSIREAMKSYPKKEDWAGPLDEAIEKTQRSERFDGSIDRGEEFKEKEAPATTEPPKVEATTEPPKKEGPVFTKPKKEKGKKDDHPKKDDEEPKTTTTEKPKKKELLKLNLG